MSDIVGRTADGNAGDAVSDAPRSITTAAGTVTVAGAATTFHPAIASPADRRRAKRLAYWSRPKPPKDWRYWVGGAGRVLIVLGLLMFGFVAYQLWGTGIEEARAQNRLDKELEEMQATLGTEPVLIRAPTAPPPPTIPGGPPLGATVPPATEPPVTEPPTVSLPPIEEGAVLGHLRIDRIDVGKNVVAGVGVADLKQGPGHFPQTPMPGELGNAAIAGHRTTFGEPFLHLDELEPGDEIVFTNLYSKEFVYVVTGSEVVSPSDGQVINTNDPSKATLTLVTCDPPKQSWDRLIVYAELDPSRSPAPTAGQEFYGQGGGSAIDELPGDAEPADDSTVAQSSAPEDSTADSSPATTLPAGADADDVGDRPAGFSDADPFAQGWFSDTAAWPHIAAWGGAIVLLCVGCYALARALRRRWVGWLVAAAPFAFLLYFFFQNVNRLLPPGL